MIQKIIVQTGNKELLDRFQENVKKIKTLNSDFEYRYFDDASIEKFMSQYPEYDEVYRKLPRNIQRYDFFRYVYLYVNGGFYFDLDIEFINPIDDTLLESKNVFPAYVDLTREKKRIVRFKKFYEANNPIIVSNYGFGCEMGSQFIKKIIDTIVSKIDYFVENYNLSTDYVLKTTGPDFITLCLMEYEAKEEITVLPISQDDNQRFGNYAIHLNAKSWV